MNQITFTIPYRGAASISLNHFKVGGNMRYKYTPEAAAIRTEIIVLAKNALQFTGWLPKAPLEVLVAGYFKNRREAIDIHNSFKLICDALEDALGVNDKDMTVNSLPACYGDDMPRIVIRVRQMT